MMQTVPYFYKFSVGACIHVVYYFFFFSSRRRHTRLQGDWSSDVCSSDLSTSQERAILVGLEIKARKASVRGGPNAGSGAPDSFTAEESLEELAELAGSAEIGRASCRERV